MAIASSPSPFHFLASSAPVKSPSLPSLKSPQSLSSSSSSSLSSLSTLSSDYSSSSSRSSLSNSLSLPALESQQSLSSSSSFSISSLRISPPNLSQPADPLKIYVQHFDTAINLSSSPLPLSSPSTGLKSALKKPKLTDLVKNVDPLSLTTLLFDQGQTKEREGNFQSALTFYKTGLEELTDSNLNDPSAKSLFGTLYSHQSVVLFKLNRKAEASISYGHALEVYTKNFPLKTSKQLGLLYQKAVSEYDIGNDDEAIKTCLNLLNLIIPSNSLSVNNLRLGALNLIFLSYSRKNQKKQCYAFLKSHISELMKKEPLPRNELTYCHDLSLKVLEDFNQEQHF